MLCLNRSSKNMIALGILIIILSLFTALGLQSYYPMQNSKSSNQLIIVYDICNVQYSKVKWNINNSVDLEDV